VPEDNRFPQNAFVNSVLRQLRDLDEQERREVGQELADHLEDASRRWLEQGLCRHGALAKAVAEMGDPVQVGRRIREEHLARGLPLREALLAGAPALISVMPFLVGYLASLIVPVIVPREAWEPWGLWGILLPSLALVLAFFFWGLRQRRLLWLATMLGYLVAMFAAALVFVLNPLHLSRPLAQELFIAGMVLLLPLVGLFTRRGSLVPSLVVLGALSFLVQFGWLMEEGWWQWYRFLALLVPFFGLVALGIAPRRRRWLVAWAVFLANWTSAALLAVYAWAWYSGLGIERGPLTIETVWRGFPSIIFLAGALALLAAQLLPYLATPWRDERATSTLRSS
jgi:hypothetical protein